MTTHPLLAQMALAMFNRRRTEETGLAPVDQLPPPEKASLVDECLADARAALLAIRLIDDDYAGLICDEAGGAVGECKDYWEYLIDVILGEMPAPAWEDGRAMTTTQAGQVAGEIGERP